MGFYEMLLFNDLCRLQILWANWHANSLYDRGGR